MPYEHRSQSQEQQEASWMAKLIFVSWRCSHTFAHTVIALLLAFATFHGISPLTAILVTRKLTALIT
jgi:hypothetical protein